MEHSQHEPVDHHALGTTAPISQASVDQLYSEFYGDPSGDSVLMELYNRDGQRKFVWAQRTSGHDVSTTYTSPSNPNGIKLDKVPDYIIERYDPYIKRDDNHNGPLFSPAPQRDIAWANIQADNIALPHFTQEEMEFLQSLINQANQNP